jgi:hypothetical protein
MEDREKAFDHDAFLPQLKQSLLNQPLKPWECLRAPWIPDSELGRELDERREHLQLVEKAVENNKVPPDSANFSKIIVQIDQLQDEIRMLVGEAITREQIVFQLELNDWSDSVNFTVAVSSEAEFQPDGTYQAFFTFNKELKIPRGAPRHSRRTYDPAVKVVKRKYFHFLNEYLGYAEVFYTRSHFYRLDEKVSKRSQAGQKVRRSK